MSVDREMLLGWLTRLKLTAVRDQLDNLVAGGDLGKPSRRNRLPCMYLIIVVYQRLQLALRQWPQFPVGDQRISKSENGRHSAPPFVGCYFWGDEPSSAEYAE